jgi:hypothetical protein
MPTATERTLAMTDLLDGIVGGLARAMAGARLDAHQVRANTELGGRGDEGGPASR